MAIAVVGGVHGKMDAMLEKLLSLPESKSIDLVLQTGDFGIFLDEKNLDEASRKHGGVGDFKDYYNETKKFSLQTYFIKGNHEDFDLLERFERYFPNPIVKNLYYLPNSRVFEIQNLRIAALGGNFSPSCYKFDKNSQKLAGGRRRHFNHQDIETLLDKKIDIILAHNSYKDSITEENNFHEIENLIRKTEPKYYFSSHIHLFSEEIFGKTKIINLGKVDDENEKSVYILE